MFGQMMRVSQSMMKSRLWGETVRYSGAAICICRSTTLMLRRKYCPKTSSLFCQWFSVQTIHTVVTRISTICRAVSHSPQFHDSAIFQWRMISPWQMPTTESSCSACLYIMILDIGSTVSAELFQLTNVNVGLKYQLKWRSFYLGQGHEI